MPTLALVGAGPGLGMSIARRFGGAGFRVGLVARQQAKLDDLARTLTSEGIEAAGIAADVRDPHAISAAMTGISERFGPIDVLEYSPLPAGAFMVPVTETSVESALAAFEFSVLGAIAAVHGVLPAMRERGSGTILFTTGGASLEPNAQRAGISIAAAGEAAYARMLHDALAADGVHVGHLAIGVGVAPGNDPGDPDDLAEILWQLHERRDRFRVTVGLEP